MRYTLNLNSIESLRAAAEKGDANAQYRLGCSLINPSSKSACEEAKKWLVRAMEQGHENARLKCVEVQNILANLYRYGHG